MEGDRNRETSPVRQAVGKAGAEARWGKDYGAPDLDQFRNEEGKIPEMQEAGRKGAAARWGKEENEE